MGQGQTSRSFEPTTETVKRVEKDFGKTSGSGALHRKENGGETGIRTLGTLAGTTVFETAPFNHSGTSPRYFEINGSQVARNIDTLGAACKPGNAFF